MLLGDDLSYKIITVYIPTTINVLSFLAVFFAYIWKPKFLSKILLYSIGLVFLWYVIGTGCLVWLQYFAFKNDALGQFFLPPHISLGYFWHYSWTHFIMSTVWVFGGTLTLGSIFLFLGVVSKWKMVSIVDLKLVVLGSLLVGWPQMLIFFAGALVLALLVALIYGIMSKQDKVLSLTPILFVSILMLYLWGNYLVSHLGLGNLII